LAIVLLIIPLAFSFSTDLIQNYRKGETLIGKISGNILEPLTANSLEFRSKNVLIAPDQGIKLLNETYYIWAVIENPGNYTLWLKNVVTTVSGIQSKIDFSQNFTILENSTLYNIKPGVISTKFNFSLDVFLYGDSSINLPISFLGDSFTEINPGKNTLSFNIDGVYGANKYLIKIGSYYIPAFIQGSSDPLGKYIKSLADVTFSPQIISRSLNNNSQFQQQITIYNKGNTTFNKVSLNYDSDIFLVEPDTFNLAPNDKETFNISLKNPLTKNFFSVINVKFGDSVTGLPISLTIINKIKPSSTNYSLANTCAELSGQLCISEQTCSGTMQESLEGNCCLGICKSTSKSDGNGWIIAIIVIILIAIGAYVYYRYKKSPKSTGTVEEKVESYELKKPKVETKLP
ncbi:MAG: hypothetical protein AABX66_04245, partial [Nanoarchaeota archaeon]